jgi:hypothetical protein
MRQTFSVGLVEIDGPGVRRLRACDPLPLQPPHARPSSFLVHSVCCVGAGRHHPDVGIVTDRARLASRIEVEARAFANADATTRNLRYGGALGLLEAGTVLGFWSRRAASRIGDAVHYAATPRMLRPMLKRL